MRALVLVSLAACTADPTVFFDPNDPANADIVVSPPSLAVAEGDTAGRTLLVSLARPPETPVVVRLGLTASGVAQLAPPTLSFTPEDYDIAQPVVVTGTDDPDGADESAVIAVSADGLGAEAVPLAISDDEVITPLVMPEMVTLVEGIDDSSVLVRLSHEPGGDVVVTASPSAGVGMAPTTFTFDAGNWDRGQPVTLTTPTDDTNDDEVESVTFTIAGEGEGALAITVDDPTEIVGFTGPFDGAPLAVVALDAFHGSPMPRCWFVEKVAIVVASATPTSMVRLGLYEHDNTKPKDRVWDSGMLQLGGGAGVRMIDVTDLEVHTDRPQSSWIAVMTTPDVTLASQSTTGMYCTKPFTFGNPLPNRFDDAPAPVCSTAAPPAIWLIGRVASGC